MTIYRQLPKVSNQGRKLPRLVKKFNVVFHLLRFSSVTLRHISEKDVYKKSPLRGNRHRNRAEVRTNCAEVRRSYMKASLQISH
jgi:hypothetical protein